MEIHLGGVLIMEIVLTYKTAKLVKRLAEELDMFLEFEENKKLFLIKGNTSQYNRYCRELRHNQYIRRSDGLSNYCIYGWRQICVLFIRGCVQNSISSGECQNTGFRKSD